MENGMVWEHTVDGEVKTDEVVRTGRRWSLAGFTGTMDDISIKERKSAARAGVVVVDCLVKSRATQLARTPAATLRGFLCDENRIIQMKDEIEHACESAFENFFEGNPEWPHPRTEPWARPPGRVVRETPRSTSNRS